MIEFLDLPVSLRTSRGVHFVGILGAGMSALAQLCLDLGLRVSGSDQTDNPRLGALRTKGAGITIGHCATNLLGADTVVFSPAVPRDNPELVAARAIGLRQISRPRALAELLGGQEFVAVAGSHGKTTTAALLAHILESANLHPGYMIGETCPSLAGGNAKWSGQGVFVNESCEAFRALDFWQPQHCIVTNVEDEHSDHYGSLQALEDAFADFIQRVPVGGRVLLCAECPTLAAIATQMADRVESYGLSPGTNWRAVILEMTPTTSIFEVWNNGRHLVKISLNLPGKHNVLNALGAIAMASYHGVSPEISAQSLGEFQSIPRRWQKLGQMAEVGVFDDLAHHPTEVAATLSVARTTVRRNGAVIAVFQPQLYSRLSRLAPDFAIALRSADHVIILPIDCAGELRGDENPEAQLWTILDNLQVPAVRAKTALEACRKVAELAHPGDLVVTMGPGLAHETGKMVLRFLEREAGLPIEEQSKGTTPVTQSTALRLQSAFEARARTRPDSPCLTLEERVWTYREIDCLAQSFAFALSKREVGRDDLVVLVSHKTPQLIALMLGTLKAGAAFVPIDPKMLRAGILAGFEQVGAAIILHDHAADIATPAGIPAMRIDAFLYEALELEEPLVSLKAETHDSDLAYAIFTSGSTGIPRLVGVEHRNVCNLLQFSTQALFDADDLALTPFIDSISFDASIHQIFATLSLGGCLLIEADMTGIMRSKNFGHITNLGGTPTVISSLAQIGALPESLRVISLGGEVIPQSLIATLRQSTKIKKLFNFYGPTETTIFSTVAQFLRRGPTEDFADDVGANIGFPVAGTIIYLCDAQDKLVPDGAIGEICIAGAGVARGYLGSHVQTEERFAPDPFLDGTKQRMYRTGDLGKRLPDGSLEFVGRVDDQMKVNGIRIDPVEIELHLNACAGIERAAVVNLAGISGRSVLTAFVLADHTLDFQQIRSDIAAKVPSAMVPKEFIRVDSLPMSSNGKLQRNDLRNPVAQKMPVSSITPASLDGVERRLVLIWRAVLQCQDLTVQDDFFLLGGDSLASVQMVMAVEKAFGMRLSAQALETIGTIEAMADQIRALLADPKSLGKIQPDLAERILDKQKAFLAAWKSENIDQSGFIRTLNCGGKKPGLFWCFQGFPELKALAKALGPDRPLHGMRSAHMIMEHVPDTIATLAHQYSEEIISLQPQGPLLLGGNCQGATIARATAFALRARGREVRHLLLMEQASIWPYDKQVGLIFGRNSSHNPYLTNEDPETAFRKAYAQGFAVEIVEGAHGEFFMEENIPSLTRAINALIDRQVENLC